MEGAHSKLKGPLGIIGPGTSVEVNGSRVVPGLPGTRLYQGPGEAQDPSAFACRIWVCPKPRYTLDPGISRCRVWP